MNTKRGIIGLGLLAAGITPMWAQDIKGVVIDQKSKETLIGAVITAVPGNGSKNATQEKDDIKAVTDIDGNFSLLNLKDGTYTLYIKYVGYKTQKIDGVQLKGGKRIDGKAIVSSKDTSSKNDASEKALLTIALQPDEQQLNEVTVTAVERRNTDAAMIQVAKNSPVIVSRVGIVAEGGGTKAAYSAGVLKCLLEHDIVLPYCVGISAGTEILLSYVSKQIDRLEVTGIDAPCQKGVVGWRPFFKEGSIFGIEATYDFIESRVPLDLEAFQNSETQMEVGIYNLKTHKVEYFDKSFIDKDETLIKASCALLLLAKPYKFNGEMWMDAYWANIWCLCTNYDMTTVSAFPNCNATLFKHFLFFNICKKFSISFFMMLFNSTYASELFSKFMKTFFISFLCHTFIHICPLIVFAFSSSLQVSFCIT